MKECRHCNKLKALELFHRNKEMRDGRSSYCKPCASERSSLWKSKNKDKARDTDLRRKYNLSLDDYESLYEEQGGSCVICGLRGSKVSRQTLFIDHCHKTGLVRGLLCHHCNSGLGYFRDDPLLLKKAQWYLNRLIETQEEED
jgi:hypothetical protein